MAIQDTVNPKKLKQQRQLEERRRKRLLDTYRIVLQTPQGRAVVNDIIVASGWEDSAWSASGMEIHRNIGRQEIGERLDKLVKLIDFELYLTMKREAASLARRDANEEQQPDEPVAPGVAAMEETETP